MRSSLDTFGQVKWEKGRPKSRNAKSWAQSLEPEIGIELMDEM
jgi:hypothetical protein